MKTAYRILAIILLALWAHDIAWGAERTILLGPKTIGAGWKDNITLLPRHFEQAEAGDVLTIYIDQVKPWAQGALQNPADGQAIAPGYEYFGLDQTIRLTITAQMLPALRTHGLRVAGHDYRICYATISQPTDYSETIVWRGPAVAMKPDWSASASLPAKCFTQLEVGQELRFHLSHVEPGAAVKLMDMTWNLLDAGTDGMPVNSETLSYTIHDNTPLIKLQLAGAGDNTAMRVGGKGYRLEQVGIVKFVGQVDTTLALAQRAPKEYVLQPGEVFHGEQVFPDDWSGNLRITAEPFQQFTPDDVLVVSYTLMPSCDAPQMSFRRNQGEWIDLGGQQEPQWYKLDGNDLVLPVDATSLHNLKMRGVVITGRGFVLRRVAILSTE